MSKASIITAIVNAIIIQSVSFLKIMGAFLVSEENAVVLAVCAYQPAVIRVRVVVYAIRTLIFSSHLLSFNFLISSMLSFINFSTTSL